MEGIFVVCAFFFWIELWCVQWIKGVAIQGFFKQPKVESGSGKHYDFSLNLEAWQVKIVRYLFSSAVPSPHGKLQDQYNTTKSPKQKQIIMQLENFKNLTQLIFPIILTQHHIKTCIKENNNKT